MAGPGDSGTTTISGGRLGAAKTIRADAGSRENKESDQAVVRNVAVGWEGEERELGGEDAGERGTTGW